MSNILESHKKYIRDEKGMKIIDLKTASQPGIKMLG